MRLTTREKAKLYDELRSMARYEEPSHGYHGGFHVIHVSTRGANDTPRNFTTALKSMIRENDE